jgi:hypothetical protein
MTYHSANNIFSEILKLKILHIPKTPPPQTPAYTTPAGHLTARGARRVWSPAAAKIVHCLLEFAGFHKFPSKKESKSCL